MRPKCCCKIRFCPKYRDFKPEGVAHTELETVNLTAEEAEALHLKNLKELQQTEAAKAMCISQSTFQRIITSAHKKISEALLGGKAIKILEKEIKK